MLAWFPWRPLISRAARARGLVDPVKVLSRLESFAQPVELKEPLELLRAGLVFHARGLLNVGAIQHNLDWVWPYWVERQYDPHDDAFLPRAFSLTHVNLTCRNWTAVGLPDHDVLPLVDPRGLVTPHWDGWSLDAWVLGDDGEELLPSRLPASAAGVDREAGGSDGVDQHWDLADGLAVVTRARRLGLALDSRVEVDGDPDHGDGDGVALRLTHRATSPAGGWLVVVLRPYNPEGVSFVHEIRRCGTAAGWQTDGDGRVELPEVPDAMRLSDYRRGDVYLDLLARPEAADRVRCKVGLATAAALYRLPAGTPREVSVRVPLGDGKPQASAVERRLAPAWRSALAEAADLVHPDPRFVALYQAALRTLVLHSPRDVYPGPYTYKRFWFRDAAFILDALLVAGLNARVARALELFPGRQTRLGHFFSQEAEWDSNGEALWILERYLARTGAELEPSWEEPIRRGARWIDKKRLVDDGATPHAGLLPAGFSAEHLGPNDYYYWDDFWSVTGLRTGAALLRRLGDGEEAARLERVADELVRAIDRSLAASCARLGRPAMPASPYRRLDSGAIGSLAAGYPLQLFAADDPRLLDTARFLLDHCLVGGGFFQDMIHSGINPYLTLHIAQVLMRAGDPRSGELLAAVAGMASPTGQWPEAIHPRTGGGCMGDGQHVWAAAEWVLALRHAFVREEADGLVLGAGLVPDWLAAGSELAFGPTPTAWGPVTVRARAVAGGVEIAWEAHWRTGEPPLRVALPGRLPVAVEPGVNELRIAEPG